MNYYSLSVYYESTNQHDIQRDTLQHLRDVAEKKIKSDVKRFQVNVKFQIRSANKLYRILTMPRCCVDLLCRLHDVVYRQIRNKSKYVKQMLNFISFDTVTWLYLHR